MAADSKKKPNIFKRIGSKITSFFKGIASELKKVTWPTKRQVFVNTVSVLAFCLVIGLIIWLCDAGFKALTTLIESWR
ncbi:MAG: preprotein translocase subunit SecE [Clostridia bacterium]|nr:preprotein translocase subunit SecE [Clostridia bacterium]